MLSPTRRLLQAFLSSLLLVAVAGCASTGGIKDATGICYRKVAASQGEGDAALEARVVRPSSNPSADATRLKAIQGLGETPFQKQLETDRWRGAWIGEMEDNFARGPSCARLKSSAK